MEEISLLSILYRTKIINIIVTYRIKDSKYREWDKGLNDKKSLLYPLQGEGSFLVFIFCAAVNAAAAVYLLYFSVCSVCHHNESFGFSTASLYSDLEATVGYEPLSDFPAVFANRNKITKNPMMLTIVK